MLWRRSLHYYLHCFEVIPHYLEVGDKTVSFWVRMAVSMARACPELRLVFPERTLKRCSGTKSFPRGVELLSKGKISQDLVNPASAGENLARYIIRASFSQERMTYILEDTKAIYQSKDGKEEKVFDTLEWPCRQAGLVLMPRVKPGL